MAPSVADAVVSKVERHEPISSEIDRSIYLMGEDFGNACRARVYGGSCTSEEIGLATLSICIPTYNRAKYLTELLNSIVDQGHPDVEVVISDDCSPDQTPEAVKEFLEKIPRLKFIRQSENIGLDRNFLAVIEAASSDYIWLVGDDDRFESGGISRVLHALDEWVEIPGLTVGVIDYNHDFSAPTGLRSMPETGRLQGLAGVFGSMPEQLGFMSALVVNRKMWNVVCQEDPILDYQNYYIQVYITGCIVKRFGSWGVLNSPCMGYRSDNDQFMSQLGWFKRLRMDVTAYDQIGKGLLGDDPITRDIMRRRIFRAHIRSRIRNAKTVDGPTPEVVTAATLLFRYYWDLPEFWYSALPMLLTPKWILRAVKTLYKRYSRSSGARRIKAVSG